MKHDQLEAARRVIATLSPDELRIIRDEISSLIQEYETGGALSGAGYLEKKIIPRKYIVIEDGKLEQIIKHYPYLYVRREIIEPNGKRRIATVGYYGSAGVAAMEAGRGDELLKVHMSGGETAGDQWLRQNGFVAGIPNRLPPRNKPPESRPVHPLEDDSITADQLEQSPVYREFARVAPGEAAALMEAVLNYEGDLREYLHAERAGDEYRLRNDVLEQRRNTEKRRKNPPRPRRISRK